MLVGDSVLLQKGDKIFRPSDVGEPVEIAGTWTLRFNNGAIITTVGKTLFMTAEDAQKTFNWTSLDNLSRYSIFPRPEHMIRPEVNWNSKIELSEYTSKEGEFDLADLEFAKFAGAFLATYKTLVKFPGAYVFNKEKFTPYVSCAEKIYPSGAVSIEDKHIVLQKCWVDELLDAVFNITDVVSIPDDLILKVSKEWVEALRDGYLSCVTWDKTRTAYIASYIYAQFLSDLGVLMNLHSIAYQIAVKENVWGNLDISIKLNRPGSILTIIDGYENVTPQILYDVGEGEFNASGVMLKG